VSRRNWAFDIALAAAVGVLGQLEVWWGIGSTHRQGPLWVQSLLYAVTALLLVGRRVRPLACLTAMVVVSVVEFVAVGSPEGFGVSVALLIATYTVGNRLEWRRSWVALALSGVVWVTWAVFDPMNTTFAERLSSLVWLNIVPDPVSAQIMKLRSVSESNGSTVCGSVNAKRGLGQYTGFLEFYDDRATDLLVIKTGVMDLDYAKYGYLCAR